ncbi:MAG: histidine kinase [Treponema sp.]|jgi:two-component system sensor histidine kinase YesM|nr:histidine kinase [Treponema sp.]
MNIFRNTGGMYISIRYKLLAVFFIFFFLATSIITSVVFLFISGMARRSVSTSNASLISYISDNISFLLNEVKDTSMFFLTNETLIALLEAPDPRGLDYIKKQDDVYRALINRMVSGDSSIESIEIIGNNGANISWNKYYADAVKYENQIQSAKNLIGSGDWTPDGQLGYFLNADGRLSFLRVLRANTNLSHVLGYLMIHLRTSRIDDIYKDRLFYENSSLYVIDANNLIITSNIGKNSEDLFDVQVSSLFNSDSDDAEPGGYFEIRGGRKKSVLFYRKLSSCDWYVVNVVPSELLLREYSTAMRYLIVVIALCSFFSILLVMFYLKKMLNPLVEVSHAMEEIEKEHYTIQIANYKNDEIGNMAKSFNHMARKLNDLIKQVYGFEIRQRDMQITTLRSQMNPHFLYNMLDVIVWKSRAERAYDTAKFTRELSMYLRKSISGSKTFSTVRDEARHLVTYINLQKSRLGDSVEFSIEIEENSGSCLTIESVLQPLVENAINHGILKGSGVGSVVVRIGKKGDTLVIEVEDDGSNEPDVKEMEKIMNVESGSHRGFAIRNINSRIKLLFGPEWGLRFHRTPDGLTIARVQQPVRMAHEARGIPAARIREQPDTG